MLQRDKELGCIPAGMEWALRYKGFRGAFLDSFQEDFNLAAKGEGPNSFKPILSAVSQRHPNFRFSIAEYLRNEASEKLAMIERTVRKQNPCLLSIPLKALDASARGFHIVPVAEVSADVVTVLWMHQPTVKEQKRQFARSLLERIHRENDGGNDLLLWSDEP